MGNTFTSCACCETKSEGRIPWIFDDFNILKRMPSRTVIQPRVYKKKRDEEDQSSNESEKEKNEEEEEETEKETEGKRSYIGGWLFNLSSAEKKGKEEGVGSGGGEGDGDGGEGEGGFRCSQCGHVCTSSGGLKRHVPACTRRATTASASRQPSVSSTRRSSTSSEVVN